MYDQNKSFLYHSFKRWVPSPPNPPPMTDEEKEEATTRRVSHPPLCKCGYCFELVNPPTRLDYTPFLYCPIPLSVIVHKRCHSFCDESIDFIFMTLDYNMFCRAISEDVISMNLFMVLGTIGRMT
jgi:hypothetical protein